MVRFIIKEEINHGEVMNNLHSNMVRFIIDGFMTPSEIVERFTFQYG